MTNSRPEPPFHLQALACPETLPVIYIHHGPQGDMVYADSPVLIVHVDDGQPQDRVFVRVSHPPPHDLVHGPVACSDHGSPGDVRRKRRLVEWLKRVAVSAGASLHDKKPWQSCGTTRTDSDKSNQQEGAA